MSERFLKFIPSDEAMWLLKKKGHAFRLLTIIAESARRYQGDPDGLKIGECYIGGHEKYDMSERNYRTAKDILVKRRHIEIVETCRTRKKSTTGTTTVGTKIKILSTNVWDINSNVDDDRRDDCPTTDRRPTADKLRMNKNDKEDHPSISSLALDGLTDDFLSKEEQKKIEVCSGVFMTQKDLHTCIKLKGSIEKVKHAIDFIQKSPKRKNEISDWPGALSRWKIENKSMRHIEENIVLAEKLSKQFEHFEQGKGWRCRIYQDKKTDQKGLLFESQSVYKEAIFVALADGEFKKKCRKVVAEKIAGEKNE